MTLTYFSPTAKNAWGVYRRTVEIAKVIIDDRHARIVRTKAHRLGPVEQSAIKVFIEQHGAKLTQN